MFFINNYESQEVQKALRSHLEKLKSPATDIVSFSTTKDLLEFSKLVMPNPKHETTITDPVEIARIQQLSRSGKVKLKETDIITRIEYHVPNDIILANTIPLKHLDVEVQKTEYGFHACFKVCISDDVTVLNVCDNQYVFEKTMPLSQVREYISELSAEERTSKHFVVGSISYAESAPSGYGEHRDFKVLIMMTHDRMYTDLKFQQIFDRFQILDDISGIQLVFPAQLDDEMMFDEELAVTILYQINQAIVHALIAFYAINAALLNPIVEYVFESRTSRIPDNSVSAKKQKHGKIRYIKRHYMSIPLIDEAFLKRGFVRKTMVWYVTGHWREYSSGKRTFIQGYWKGPLRAVQRALDKTTPRDREIVMPEV